MRWKWVQVVIGAAVGGATAHAAVKVVEWGAYNVEVHYGARKKGGTLSDRGFRPAHVRRAYAGVHGAAPVPWTLRRLTEEN
jgi:hypothetical protein